jgi:hypothetical protein
MKIITTILISITLTSCCPYVITPVEMTRASIGETFYRVYLYGKANHKIPYSFNVLPIRDGYGNCTTDGWNRGLILEIKDDKVMTLTSYGKDGKLGGEGEDSDISESHWLRREDGSLWVGDEMWVVESEIKEENDSNQKLPPAVKTSVDSVNAQSTQPHP